jgi:hypothetical protein
MVYLLKGDIASFRAVREAHREFRRLRDGESGKKASKLSRAAAVSGQQPATLRGWYRGWIVPRALIGRGGPVKTKE